MKTFIAVLTTCLLLLSFTGCAPVKVYSDPALTKSTGFLYFPVKPYIEVEKDTKNGAIVKATVLYLPDLSNPQYLSVRGGLGSRKLDVDLKNGIIEKLGVTSDTKIPETIESLAASVSKTAEAMKDISGIRSTSQSVSSVITELYEVEMGSGGTTLKKVEFR